MEPRMSAIGELIDYWIDLAREKGIEKEEPSVGPKGKATNPYRVHAVWFAKLLNACGKDVDRAKRALAFYFADNYPGVSSLGWSIGAFSKRYLGYVVKVKADDDMKARLARRYVEERTEAAERASVPLPVNMPPEVRERTEALRRRITGR